MKEKEEANKKKEIKIPPYNIKTAKRGSPSYCIFHYVRKYEKTDKNIMLSGLVHAVFMHFLKRMLNTICKRKESDTIIRIKNYVVLKDVSKLWGME